MSIFNCHKQEPQPWMSYISQSKICFPGGCCPSLVTDNFSLLPFQIISEGDYIRSEISVYGSGVWTEITLPITSVVTEGFYIHTYDGSTITELECGAYEFRVVAGETWWFEPFTVEDFEFTENAYKLRDLLMTPLKFGEQPIDCGSIIAPCDSFLPFMYTTENATGGSPTYTLVSLDGTETALTITVTVLTIDGRTYYIHDGECFYPFLECGRYYIRIDDGAYSYFSAWFDAVCGMNDIPDGYRAMRDANGCVMRDDEGVILTEECSPFPTILLNDSTNPTKVYSYNAGLESIELLTTPGTVWSSPDIAHTENKLWLYSYVYTPLPVQSIQEFNITLDPFTAISNRHITGFINSSGLCAKDNNTLIGVQQTTVGLDWILKVYECDITTNISNNVYKFDLLPNRSIGGDYLLTTTNKLIVTTSATGVKHITQYNYLTGALEVDIQISPTILIPNGVFEYNNDIYIADVRIGTPTVTYIWKVNKYSPYTLTLSDEISLSINGASEIPSLSNVHFIV